MEKESKTAEKFGKKNPKTSDRKSLEHRDEEIVSFYVSASNMQILRRLARAWGV